MPLISKPAEFIIDFIRKEIHKNEALSGQSLEAPYFVLSYLPPGLRTEQANWETTPIHGTPEMLAAFDRATALAKQHFDMDALPLGRSTFY